MHATGDLAAFQAIHEILAVRQRRFHLNLLS